MANYGLKSITVGSNTYEMNTKNALGISLNGGSLSFDGSTANQSVSFYAPTTAGTNGYFLKSNGSGAPTWAEIENGPGVGFIEYNTEMSFTDFDDLMAKYSGAIICTASPNDVYIYAPLISIDEEQTITVSSSGSLSNGSATSIIPFVESPHSGDELTISITFYNYDNVVTVPLNCTYGTPYDLSTTLFGVSGHIVYQNSQLSFSFPSQYWSYDYTVAYESSQTTYPVFRFGAVKNVDESFIYYEYKVKPSLQDDLVEWEQDTYGLISDPVLNGSSVSTLSFYAPTTAGTDGYYLRSNGSGAPTWAQIPAGVTVTLNGSTTTTPSFYAPTTAGMIGYVLRSNGSGAPTWVSAALTDTKVTVAENTMATKYYPILATGTGTATRQIDTDDQVDSNADAVGLWYQNGILCAPSLQVGDVDYAITTAEYEALMDAIDAI